jgi:hypothetical protein
VCSSDLKMEVSHRAQALRGLKAYLDDAVLTNLYDPVRAEEKE